MWSLQFLAVGASVSVAAAVSLQCYCCRCNSLFFHLLSVSSRHHPVSVSFWEKGLFRRRLKCFQIFSAQQNMKNIIKKREEQKKKQNNRKMIQLLDFCVSAWTIYHTNTHKRSLDCFFTDVNDSAVAFYLSIFLYDEDVEWYSSNSMRLVSMNENKNNLAGKCE